MPPSRSPAPAGIIGAKNQDDRFVDINHVAFYFPRIWQKITTTHVFPRNVTVAVERIISSASTWCRATILRGVSSRNSCWQRLVLHREMPYVGQVAMQTLQSIWQSPFPINTMSNLNPEVDQYIAKSADFAKPLMKHLRAIIHETCPEVTEVIKWGIPHFDYKGDMMCILAAYKHHCSFSLYKAELMTEPKIVESVKAGKKMGYMDKLKTLADLPKKKILADYIKEAMTLNENGSKKVKPKSAGPKLVETPDYFKARLSVNPKAKGIFEAKSASFRKNYIVWITDAKTEETRQKRMDESLGWIAEGKGRFWQYEK